MLNSLFFISPQSIDIRGNGSGHAKKLSLRAFPLFSFLRRQAVDGFSLFIQEDELGLVFGVDINFDAVPVLGVLAKLQNSRFPANFRIHDIHLLRESELAPSNGEIIVKGNI